MQKPITEFDYVVYHEYCPDGISSAWVTSLVNENAIRIGCFAGKNPVLSDSLTNKTILFCDICPTPEYLKLLVDQKVKHVLVIDHHKDAISKISNIPEISYFSFLTLYTNTDNTKSGCILTWEYFFPNKPAPWFLEYISDRDTWNFKLPFSKEINSGLVEDKHITMEGLNKLYSNVFTLSNILSRGTIIEEFRNRHIEKFAKTAILCKYKDMYIWLYSGLPEYRSDVGNYLLNQKFKDEHGVTRTPDFAVAWQYDIRSNEYWLSLRSENTKADVCEIAKCIDKKGGGHRNAAGCTINGDYELRTLFVPV